MNDGSYEMLEHENAGATEMAATFKQFPKTISAAIVLLALGIVLCGMPLFYPQIPIYNSVCIYCAGGVALLPGVYVSVIILNAVVKRQKYALDGIPSWERVYSVNADALG